MPTSQRVLVVDDEEANRILMTRLLSAEGYVVTTASTGDEALAFVRDEPPDLILLDVRMPGIDGLEVCRRLKDRAARTRLVPIILVTALVDHTHRLLGIQAGADDFIGKPFDSAELKARVASLLRLKRYTDELDSAEAIIEALARTIEARDAYTEGHCDRLSRYSVAMGRELKLSDDEIQALNRGGYLHDIGKVGIPDAILLKPGELTPSEFEIMKQHTLIGERLCGELRAFHLVAPICRHHHERFDGSGYPRGLKGDAIPLLAQIVAVADVYDAVTTTRPYRVARPASEACRILREEAAQGRWQPDLVPLFTALVEDGAIAGIF
jgi:putative two-component system response regulator